MRFIGKSQQLLQIFKFVSFLSFSKLSDKTNQTKSNTSTKYIHKSHMSAVVYIHTFHRPIHLNSKVSQSSYHFTIFQRIQVSKAKPS